MGNIESGDVPNRDIFSLINSINSINSRNAATNVSHVNDIAYTISISSIPATVMSGVETVQNAQTSMKNIEEICTRLVKDVDVLQEQQTVISKRLALQGLCLQQFMLTDVEIYSAHGEAIKVGDSELHEEESQLSKLKEVNEETQVQKSTKSKRKKRGRSQATLNASSQSEEPISSAKATDTQASSGHLQPKSNAGLSLVEAAQAGNISELQALLDAGADPNISGVGVTALQRAASGGHLLCVSLLLKRGARLDTPEVLGRTALHLASLHGHIDCMVELIEHKASLTHKDLNGQMPLHYAAIGGFEEAVKEILKRGVGIDVTDEFGQTPLYLAVMFDKPGPIWQLMAAGAKRKTKEGKPLTNFARSDRVERLLIRNW